MPEPRQVVITFLNGERAEYPLVTVQPLKLVADMVQDEEEDKDVTQAPIEIPLPACNKPLFDDVFELLVILQETGTLPCGWFVDFGVAKSTNRTSFPAGN